MTPLLQDLRDIRGLDPAPWWPVAPGWWLVVLATLLIAAVTVLVARWWRNRVPGSWQADARRQLRVLEERLRWADARTAAAELSELLRRVAMARHGRRACAGLVGESWLAWLERHDPAGFPWREEGRALVDLPYAPPGRRAAGADLEPLLRAARSWVVADAPAGRDGARGERALVARGLRLLQAARGAARG